MTYKRVPLTPFLLPTIRNIIIRDYIAIVCIASINIALWETNLRKSIRSNYGQDKIFFSNKAFKKNILHIKNFLIIFIFLTFLKIDYGSSY